MRGKTREILENATVCFICGEAPSPGNPLVVRDLNSFALPRVVAMGDDLSPNPQAVHRDCKARRSPPDSITAWGVRGWYPAL